MTKILVVEDQIHNTRLIEQILEDVGNDLQLVKADSGRQAIEKAKIESFDLVLMDIALPDMDGIQITKILRGFPQYKQTPFIAVSAYAMLNEAETFRQVFDDYISKPIDEDDFIAIIQKWLCRGGRHEDFGG